MWTPGACYWLLARRGRVYVQFIIISGGDLIFRPTKKRGQNTKNAERNAAFLAFLPILLRQTGKHQPGAALEHVKKANFF